MTKEKKERSIFLHADTRFLIWNYLDEPSQSALSKTYYNFGKSSLQNNRILAKLAQYAYKGNTERVAHLATIRPDLRIPVLFTLAGLGAQDEMEILLKQHPEDLLVFHPLRDISGAQFESISLFQHCIWTKDVRYMAHMMLDCLPKNTLGEEIRLKLAEQYKELIEKGVVYHLHGVKHENERHFNLQPLITALRTHEELPNFSTFSQRNSYWCTTVGREHTRIPAHIRHHYCEPEKMPWVTRNFKKPRLTRSLGIYNWVLNKHQLWAEGLDGLGRDFAICGPASRYDRECASSCEGRDMMASCVALIALDEVRTNTDLPALIKRLHTPIQTLKDDLDKQSMRVSL